MPKTTKKLRIAHSVTPTTHHKVKVKDKATNGRKSGSALITAQRIRAKPTVPSTERWIEKVPSKLMLLATFGSIASTAALQFVKRRRIGRFLGDVFPAAFSLFGVYQEVVRTPAPRANQKAKA